jgi:hypothetical protein
MQREAGLKNMRPHTKRARRKRAVRAANRVPDQATRLYTPLNTQRNEIRLVILNPGDLEDEIRCHLYIASLDNDLIYEALSYVWGDQRMTRQIFIDGLPRRITSNLEIALRYLRHISQPRFLWIDAICINQIDVSERNVQIRHMGNVYTKASRVIAWLGEEYENSNLACDAMDAFPTDEQLHWDPNTNSTFDGTFLEPEYISALQCLLLRPWWQRVWTVQESILGSSMSILCGHRQMSMDKLCSISLNYYRHARSCCQSFLQRQGAFWDLEDPMGELYDLWKWRAPGFDRGLIDLLSEFRCRQCLDPRDKVYGLLGLCIGVERNTVIPDYSMPVSLVYEQVALKLIESS